jgi:hypothetical protein
MELSKIKEPPKIRVVVRKRPLGAKESNQASIIEILDAQHLSVQEMK